MKQSLAISVALLLTACSGGSGDRVTADTNNRPPVAVSDSVETAAGASKLIDVLANDQDPDGDTLTLTIIQQPANGVAYVDEGVAAGPDGDTIVYTPDTGFSGQDEIVYTISDGSNGRATGVAMVTVLPPPDPVTTAKADSAVTLPNVPMDVHVLANDVSDGSLPLAIASVTVPLAGTATIEDNATTDTTDDYLRYAPTPGFIGTDSFIYQLTGGQRAVVQIDVNPDPGLPSGATVSGSVIKGRMRDSIVQFFNIDPDGNRIGSAVAQTVTDDAGHFTAVLPLPRTSLLAVSNGGEFIDETDSQSNPADRRVIVFAADDELASLLPATADYVAINIYTNSIVRSAIRTAAPGQFELQYTQLHTGLSTALGFDPVITEPVDPDAPDPTGTIVSRQYAMALGGIATALNKVAVNLGQDAMSYPVVSGVIDDLSRCLLDGVNEDGPVQVLLENLLVPIPGNVNLNTEILRFRNNKIADYLSTPLLQIDLLGCDDSPPPPPPPPPPTGNSSPTALNINSADIDENSAAGTLVGTFATTDLDPGDSHTYTLVTGVGDSSNSSFVITGNQLLSNAIFDFETQSSYSIRVRTDDLTSPPFERTFVISIGDINEPPVAVTLDFSTIDENLATGTVIGTFTSTDDDPGDSHTYTLVPGVGDTGNGSFSIVGDQLVSSVVFDFEAQSSYSIRMRTDDTVTTPFERNFTITVSDVNEAPTALSLDTAAIDENLATGTVIGTFTSTDDDPGDSHTYTLVPGVGDTGNGSFSIVGDQLVSSVVFDFEAQSSYSIRMRTDDTVTTPFERNFTITVSDVNEAPTALSLDTAAIDENLATGTVIGTFTSTDDDPGDSHTYTLVPGVGDTGNGSFSIVGDQLVSSVVFDFEAQSSYSIRMRTDDTVTTPFERNFTITVSDVNEAPTALSLDTAAIDENLATGTVIGTFTSTDDDPGDSHTYTLVPGVGDTGNGSFSIVGDQLVSSVIFDFEAQSSYSIRMRTDDTVTTPFERNFTITVSDVNEAPEPGDDSSLTTVDGPMAIDVLSNDFDPDGDPLTITVVTSPTSAGGTAIINDNATPADTTDDFVDYTPPAAYSGADDFSYTVSDGLLSASANVAINVSNLGYVSSISPPDGAGLIPIGQTIVIVFNQAMNAATLDATTLVVSLNNNGSPPLPATVSYDPGTLTATIDPATDLDSGTLYYVVVSNLIEDDLGNKQGFKVKTSFTTAPTTNDADFDGLTDFEEATIGGCLDAMNADSDDDGIGDGAEYRAGGNPCSDQGQAIWYVDDDGAAGGWPTASTSFGGYSSGTAGNPNYVLVAEGTYLDQINYAANCDYLVFAGSQNPAIPGSIIKNADGSPTTIVDMENSRNSEFASCAELTLRDIHMTGGVGNGGTKGGGIRVSGTTTATLDSVWLTNNTTGDQGGGLGVSNFSVATLRNSVIRDNLVTGGKGGGGVWVGANATLDIADTLVIDNRATAIGGGGLYFDPLATGTVVNTYVVANTTTGDGGGIFILNNNGSKDTIVDIEDSVIAGNSAASAGGGIFIDGIGAGGSAFNVNHNRIYDNQSSSGAGIMLESTGTIVTVLDNLILGNNAPLGGAGIYVNNAGPELRNNTIIYNRTGQPSGAAVAAAGGANPLIRDSIIWQNRAGARPLSSAVTANDNYTPSVVQSDFNLLEVDKIGASDVDFVNDGVIPGFDAGFYLNQLTSPAVDAGSDTAIFLSLDTRLTAAGGPADAGTVDRGFHHPTLANYPADGYVETGGTTNNEVTVTDADSGANAVMVLIRPLVAGVPMGSGHYVVASLEGPNAGLAQLGDTANVDPLSDNESVVLSDLGDGTYRAYIASEAPAGAPTTIPLRIYVDKLSLPIIFNIDRIP